VSPVVAVEHHCSNRSAMRRRDPTRAPSSR